MANTRDVVFLTDADKSKVYPVAHWEYIDGKPDLSSIGSGGTTSSTSNLILVSPAGTSYSVTVDDTGRLKTTQSNTTQTTLTSPSGYKYAVSVDNNGKLVTTKTN